MPTVSCPICKKHRTVFRQHYDDIRNGKLSGRCLPCHKAMRKREAAQRRLKVTIACPDCKKVRAVEARQKRAIDDGKYSGRCNSCENERRRAERKPKSTICVHCCKSKVTRPRGLCWNCYYTPAVSSLYKSTSKYARRSAVPANSRGPLPTPTTAMPGTPEKIAVMEARALRGEALFHPRDAKHEDESAIPAILLRAIA